MTPPFMTMSTRSIACRSARGSPRTAIRSASLPFSIEPILSCMSMIRAFSEVARRRISAFGMPAAAKCLNSSVQRPKNWVDGLPISVPMPTSAPIRWSFFRFATALAKVSLQYCGSNRSACCSLSLSSLLSCALSSLTWAVICLTRFGHQEFLPTGLQKLEQLVGDQHVSENHHGGHDGHSLLHELLDVRIGDHRIDGHVLQSMEAEVNSLLEPAHQGLVKGALDPGLPALRENRAVALVTVVRQLDGEVAEGVILVKGLQPLGAQRDHPVTSFLDLLDVGGPLRVVAAQEPLDDRIGEVGGGPRCAELVALSRGNRRERADHPGTGDLVRVGHRPELLDLAGEPSHVPDGGDPAHDAVPEVEGDLPIHLGDGSQVHVIDEGDGDVDVVVDQAGQEGPAAEVHRLVGGNAPRSPLGSMARILPPSTTTIRSFWSRLPMPSNTWQL